MVFMVRKLYDQDRKTILVINCNQYLKDRDEYIEKNKITHNGFQMRVRDKLGLNSSSIRRIQDIGTYCKTGTYPGKEPKKDATLIEIMKCLGIFLKDDEYKYLDEYSKKIENMTIDQKLNLIEQLIEEIMILENREIYIKKIQSKLKW